MNKVDVRVKSPDRIILIALGMLLLPLASIAQDSSGLSRGVSESEVDALFDSYQQKLASGNNKNTGYYAFELKQALEEQFNESDRAHYKGKACSVRIQLSPEGKVLGAQAISGDADFCHATLNSVKKATFPKPYSSEIYAQFKNPTLNVMF